MLDIRQTTEYAEYLSKIGWGVERIRGINYFIRKFPLIGSLIKIQRPESINYSAIQQLSNKHRAFQIIVETKTMADGQWLIDNGFKASRSPFLPSKTLQLDLIKSEEQLLKEMKKDARAALRQTENLEIKQCLPLRGKRLKNENEIGEFRESWKRAVGWRRYVPPLSHLITLKESFKNNCLFLTIKHSNDSNRRSVINSGAIFLIGDKTAYYWQAFTDKGGRKAQAQYKIVWEGILWAKRRGAKVFDFEGIYDPRFPDKSWQGFTHFKKSFGGYEVEYPGAFVKNLMPF